MTTTPGDFSRLPIIGVVGGGKDTAPSGSPTYAMAEKLGELVATAKAILLCGGGTGIMEAAAVGARNAGGHTVGIMPSQQPPNAGIEHCVWTGMGDGRNFLNATVPDVVIAMAGGAGTLSEIALALKAKTPVVYLAAWNFLNVNGLPAKPYVTSPSEAIDEAFKALGIRIGGRINRAVNQPSVPNQTANLGTLANVVMAW